MRISMAKLIQRVAEMHDTWFLEETVVSPEGARRYRLLEKQGGKPLSEWTTGWGMKMFLDGYERGHKDVREKAS